MFSNDVMLEKTNAFRFVHVSSYLGVDVVRTWVHVAIYQQLVLEASKNRGSMD